MKNVKNKKLALAVVALILAALTAVSMTYAWIDDVKLVEFDNDSLSDNRAPLKTGVDINSTVNITKDENMINLGNLLENSDLTVSTGEGQRTEVKHDLTNTEKANINKKKGYFYESGGMHLSPCYSDGETFYFERQGNQQGYREGNKDDENVNYISYTVKVTSPDANVDFWFKSIPSIAVANSENLISNARIAITTDGISHVYSSTGLANTISNSATVPVSGVRRFSSYTYDDESNKTVARGKNSNTLFSVKKGSTVILNIKIWLESGFDTRIKASDIDLQLVSSWVYTRKIWIDDKTTNGSGGTWVDDNGAKLYVTFPEFLHEKQESPSDWPDVTNGPFYEVQTQNSEYYVEVPLVYNNEKMILYRCNSTDWNNSASGAVQRSDYNVYCWNWWQTYTPNTYVDATYTLYGGSKDDTANGYFESIKQGFTVTNKGYGTWGAVEEIKVFSYYNNGDNNVDLATKNDGKAMYVVDHSDEDTSGEAYIYEMYRSGSTSSDPWKTYVPAGSAKIQFRYFGSTAGLSWGYNSWNGENPQRRPLASSGLYPNNATEYQLAAIFDNVNGWGYWRDTSGNEYDKVYLVKNGMFWDKNNVYDNLYDDSSHGNGSWPGHQMTRMKNASNQDVSWSDNSSPIFESDTARPGSTIYNHLRFSDGADGSTGFDNCTKTDVLKVFPGCFYNPGDSKWYGAIDDKGRDATETPQEPTGGGGSGGGSDIGGGSMAGFTEPTTFVFKINGTEYDVKTDGTTYKVRLTLTAGHNWTIVQKKEGNYPTYGNSPSGQFYKTKSNMDVYLTTANRNNFSIRTASSGNFIAAFQYDNGNQNTIKITSILKED